MIYIDDVNYVATNYNNLVHLHAIITTDIYIHIHISGEIITFGKLNSMISYRNQEITFILPHIQLSINLQLHHFQFHISM